MAILRSSHKAGQTKPQAKSFKELVGRLGQRSQLAAPATLAMGSYILGWLKPTEPIYPSSRSSLYLIMPWRFRFSPASV